MDSRRFAPHCLEIAPVEQGVSQRPTHGRMSESRIFELLSDLIDGWCARRALHPLHTVLGAYLGFNGLTDGWIQLWQAVNDLRGLGDRDLTETEREKVSELRAAIHQRFNAAGRAAELGEPAG